MGKWCKTYKPRQKVMLILDGEKEVPDGLMKFNQEIFRVGKVKHMHDPSFSAKATWTYYELKGCESEKGVPYSILADWLYDIGAWVGDD